MTTTITLLSTDIDAATLADVAAVLTPAETARAARWRQPADARRYMVTRGALRLLLAARVGAAPQSLMFRQGARGKPVLDHFDIAGVHFNVSHAGDWAVIALAASPVGIDIEQCRPLDYRSVGAQVFSAAEQARIDQAVDRAGAFFDLWTAKEALLKAWGLGLGDMPAGFTTPDLDDAATGTAHFAPMAGLTPAAPGWMARLSVPAGYRGTVCVQQPCAAPTFTFSLCAPETLLRAGHDLQCVR
jgi:4'-phosphopantetheinyl transferase